jgi:hypothetical protein
MSNSALAEQIDGHSPRVMPRSARQRRARSRSLQLLAGHAGPDATE